MKPLAKLAAICFSAFFMTPVHAKITVTQVGDDLFVFGNNENDNLKIDAYEDYAWVYENDDPIDVFSVTKVWVNTGNGKDYVYVYSTDGDVCIDTGNGDDCVFTITYDDGLVDLSTGNGNDYVDSYASSTNYYYYYGVYPDEIFEVTYEHSGGTTIDTGRGDDEVVLESFGSYYESGPDYYYFIEVGNNWHVTLGQGDDTVSGDIYDAFGSVDGGQGTDTCSSLTYAGTLDVNNCEN